MTSPRSQAHLGRVDLERIAEQGEVEVAELWEFEQVEGHEGEHNVHAQEHHLKEGEG
jgi:hypothetical protein